MEQIERRLRGDLEGYLADELYRSGPFATVALASARLSERKKTGYRRWRVVFGLATVATLMIGLVGLIGTGRFLPQEPEFASAGRFARGLAEISFEPFAVDTQKLTPEVTVAHFPLFLLAPLETYLGLVAEPLDDVSEVSTP